MKTRLLFLITLFLSASMTWGQSRSISGKVVSATDGEPIIGASVLVKGTTNGTITDLEGTFKLSGSPNEILVFSFVGYVTQEIAIGGNTTFSVLLKEDTQILDDIVVIGYGTQRKADLSSSITVLDTKELEKVPGGLAVGLQSSVAGVQMTNGRIRVRGVGSINNTDPLYVVDGMIGGVVPDESNIASIQVLKDAASCAIYGARGANGVIMITTKRGATGDVKISYDGYAGWKGMSHDVDMLNGQELAELINEAMYNENPNRTDYLAALSDPAAIGEGYNMMNELKRTAFFQKHNLSVSGGSDKANFRINTTYSTDQPIFIREDYKNYGIQLISDFTKGKLKLGETITINRNLHDWSDTKILGAQKWSSTCPIYDENHVTGFAGAGNGTDCGNPLAESHMNWNKGEGTTINGNVWATYEFIPGLKYKFNMGVDMYRYVVQNYIADYSIGYENHSPDEYKMSTSKSNRFLYENTLSYDKIFGKHNLSALIGVTSEETKGLGHNGGARAMPSPDILILGSTQDNSSKVVGSDISRSSMFSLLGRVNYSYDSKYMMTFNFRRDGSSNFSKNNRYGNFPSVSAAWRISQEKFMQGFSWLSDLKLRGSWGMLGNSLIDPYQYQSTVNFDGIWYYLNDSKVSGALPTTPSNPDVKWETQYSTDLGLDLTVLNNRLTFTMDYYYKKTKDMLIQVPISFTAGYMGNFPTLNAGSIENQGFEFTLTYRDQIGNWDYSVSGNLTTVKNKVLDLGSNNAIFAANSVTKTAVGKSIGQFWGYVTDGLYKTQAQLDEDKVFAPNAQLGDIRFKNLNNDNELSDADKDYIGNPIPKFTYGLSADVSYKAAFGTIDFAMIWQGSQGNDIFNYSRVDNEGMHHYYNNTKEVLNRYRAEDIMFVNPVSGVSTFYPKNTDTNMPRAIIGDPNQNRKLSDRYVEDGSYLRLKALTLGYTFPKQLLNKFSIEHLRIYVGAKNLLTLTSYKGYDPEVGDQDRWSGKNLTRGVDGMSLWDPTFPNTREFYVGLQLTF
ncbi:TonB-dependent receptor [Bacteroides sp. 51]|uniref:SusC/RagA family TonB-linked outer membrane protein n=1 Tax=Bacteroides sp. 51 TaxID=2302938 RepID=UPI0013D80385|nr:TonB-dependent receptor [Bacteroides sp. 51]NDV80888.1 TonB-dependent receptor [Bacteroides sp. 51]